MKITKMMKQSSLRYKHGEKIIKYIDYFKLLNLAPEIRKQCQAAPKLNPRDNLKAGSLLTYITK